ncbi:uncharacterized protein LOC113378634 isoform X1 [Ctenocephalides felis]|uniref:uncharacterized protein LOC113378634 isoform X1 n=1 Tax=Ctenocephalides felis TaxID=7515 RepID=UPI000E6E2E67|nr:uncharacterized protein LOC113378634 isoform X1 [Ctenocephalides felis]
MALEITTEDALEYQYNPVTGGSINFKVRASNDAHIALTTGSAESEPMYEVFIGGWGNTKSVIRRNRTKPEVAETDTPDILNAGEFRGFWIRWQSGVVTVGREGEAAAFLTYEDPEPFNITHYGVCTGWGATGSWKIEGAPAGGWVTPSAGGSACWVDASNGEVPPNALSGGKDGDEELFVGRARHEGALLPGKIVPSHGVCYVAWGGGEHGVQEYQVLCSCDGTWVATQGANIPDGALPAGETEDGEPLFVGRAEHEGTVTVGKVQVSHGVCYIPYAGQEMGFDTYEVLVFKQ